MTRRNATTKERGGSQRGGARGAGWWAQDPYGRGRVLKFIAFPLALLYGLTLLVEAPTGVAYRLGVITLPCLWLAGLGVVWLWSPAPRAGRKGETLVVRVTPWKRVALPIVLPLPAWFLAFTSFSDDPRVGWWIGGTLVVMIALYWSLREQFHLTDWGIARPVVALGPKQKIAWSDITRMGVWPAGLTLGAPGKSTIVLTGILLDGYPEVVREVLRRIPHVVDAIPEARERLERIAALVPGNGNESRPAG